MFVPTNIEETRHMLSQAWHKHRNGDDLNPLEQQICSVLNAHPEYHSYFESIITLSETDTDNPYLHISLHIALLEQISTNRPNGIAKVYQDMCQEQDPHDVQHLMMQVLCEYVGYCLQQQKDMDEKEYLSFLNQLPQMAPLTT
ncbi:MAG: hypothetical protein CMF48_01770 [Legionellales bacterium]|nr:hypothetical protein [Legionellales bacterium]